MVIGKISILVEIARRYKGLTYWDFESYDLLDLDCASRRERVDTGPSSLVDTETREWVGAALCR